MVDPIHRHLNIEICADPADAIARGYDYSKQDPRPKPIAIEKVVVVRKGMVSGAASVDFLLQDDTGQRYVFMVTGNLLKTIPC